MLVTKNQILVLGKGKTNGLDDNTITIQTKYSVNISKSTGTISLILHYINVYRLLFANGVIIYQFNGENTLKQNHINLFR